jgi:hypothetical protein
MGGALWQVPSCVNNLVLILVMFVKNTGYRLYSFGLKGSCLVLVIV